MKKTFIITAMVSVLIISILAATVVLAAPKNRTGSIVMMETGSGNVSVPADGITGSGLNVFEQDYDFEVKHVSLTVVIGRHINNDGDNVRVLIGSKTVALEASQYGGVITVEFDTTHWAINYFDGEFDDIDDDNPIDLSYYYTITYPMNR
jgi:hypothetical protein